MPKSVKSKAPRPSPVKVGATLSTPAVAVKAKKARAPSVIVSTNHDLPTVSVSPDELSILVALKSRSSNRQDVDFNCLFTKQNKFGGFEFQLTDSVHDSLMDIINNTLEFEETEGGCCISKDDYTGHWRMRGKLSKSYLASYPDRSKVPVPEDGSIVHVSGGLETSTMKGKNICYFQIDGFEQIVQAGEESEDEE